MKTILKTIKKINQEQREYRRAVTLFQHVMPEIKTKKYYPRTKKCSEAFFQGMIFGATGRI